MKKMKLSTSVCRCGGRESPFEWNPAHSNTNKVKTEFRGQTESKMNLHNKSFRNEQCFFVFRRLGKNAAQRVCFCGGVSGERGWHRAELECDCPLQTGGRGVALQEGPGRGPV